MHEPQDNNFMHTTQSNLPHSLSSSEASHGSSFFCFLAARDAADFSDETVQSALLMTAAAADAQLAPLLLLLALAPLPASAPTALAPALPPPPPPAAAPLQAPDFSLALAL